MRIEIPMYACMPMYPQYSQFCLCILNTHHPDDEDRNSPYALMPMYPQYSSIINTHNPDDEDQNSPQNISLREMKYKSITVKFLAKTYFFLYFTTSCS